MLGRGVTNADGDGHGRPAAAEVGDASAGTAAREAAIVAETHRRPRRRRALTSAAWQEAKALIWARRGRLALGLALMLVNRLSGLVLPATSKYLIDDVIGKGRAELLMPLALAAGAATLVQAVTSFALSQVLGVAAQRAITDMRRRVEAHVARLPDQLLRLDAVRRPDLADHDRRRRHPEPGRHRPRPARPAASSRRVLALGVLFYLNW